MKSKFLNTALTGLILSATCLVNVANSGIITHGYLTTDDASNYITDTNTGRLYTRFDAFDWTVAQTLTAIESDGEFEGWNVMTSTQADEFIAAALGRATTSCHTSNFGTICGGISGWSDGDFGASFDHNEDYFGFIDLKAGERGYAVGEIGYFSGNSIRRHDNWGYEATMDGYNSSHAINLTLYKDIKMDVPEPSTLAIFALGLMGLASRRFKKH